MSRIFTQTPVNKPRSNKFNLSHDKKLSLKMGNLTPVLIMDTVPGDSITLRGNMMIRLAPMLSPVMHRINAYIHYFFVPNRIIWDGWEDFITGGDNGDDETVWPYLEYEPTDYEYSSLPDYMGLPTNDDVLGGGEPQNVSAIPFAAYNKIYNEYYRDQNLITPVVDELIDGEQTSADDLLELRRRAWQHDYFTSALPWTQKGPEAMLPLGSQAPVKAKNDPDFTENYQQLKGVFTNTGITGATVQTLLNSNITDGTNEAYIDLLDSHFADLSEATASSINDLRRAFKLQEWLEKNARGGSRYTESIKVHFAVNTSDKRLQRPEYIGGVKTPVQISEVLNTSGSTDNPSSTYQPQGTMAGHALATGSGGSFKYYCEEHGYIIGIMSIMPESAYMQGIPKHFLRQDKFDYYWPEFAHIGEQPIYGKELIVTGFDEYNNGVFGYTPRYAEYKFMPNTAHGDFKGNLDFWHLTRKFATAPALNQDFIECDPQEVERIFAVQDGTDNIWAHVYNEVYARRLMPVFGVPRIM